MPGVLSHRDNLILGFLFDTKAEAEPQPPQSQPASLPGIPADNFAALRDKERTILDHLNVSNPSRDTIERAIDSLSEILNEHPAYGSALVNRAQARRLLVPMNQLFTEERAQETQLLMADLDRASEVSSPRPRSQQVSSYEQSVLATTHTHRAFLLMRASDIVRDGGRLYGASEGLSCKDAEAIDEMVFRDFKLGGFYGEEEAAKMAVRTNPYAKLCGAIVSEAMNRETSTLELK